MVQKVDVEERTVEHVISTAALDRGNDVIDIGGWDTKDFEGNPVVLADHTYSVGAIIGASLGIERTSKALKAVTKFHDTGAGAAAFDLVQAGIAKAWSVGFEAGDSHRISEGRKKLKCTVCKKNFNTLLKGRDPEDVWIYGRHYLSQKLYEYSLVAIPANPEAVMSAISKGLVTEETAPWFFKQDGGDSNEEELLRKLFDALQGSTAMSGKVLEMLSKVGSTLGELQTEIASMNKNPNTIMLTQPPKVSDNNSPSDDEQPPEKSASQETNAVEESEPAIPCEPQHRLDAVIDVAAALRQQSRGLFVKANTPRSKETP
jgi:phage head maturation protease